MNLPDFEFEKCQPQECNCEECVVRKEKQRQIFVNHEGAICLAWVFPKIQMGLIVRLLPGLS